MSELLAVGDTTAASADFTVTDPVTLFLTSDTPPTAPSGAFVAIQAKTAAGAYYTVASLDYTHAGQVVYGPGTYRVQRIASGVRCGVEQGE